MASILLISLSLAMDALSISIAGGIKSQAAKVTQALKVALFFGTFQAIMPIIGWLIGEVMEGVIGAFDHWIAFILLGVIGVKMIRDALSSSNEGGKDILKIKTLLLLAVATSIDALVIGVTLSLLEIPFLVSVITIGIVTFILCFLGFLFGKKLGGFWGKKMEIIGGIALILIGSKILIGHLIPGSFVDSYSTFIKPSPTPISVPSPSGDNIFSCTEDSDCVSIRADNCGCTAGGTATAINKKQIGQWEKDHPRGICVAVVSGDWTCVNATPKCLSNECELVRRD